MHYITYLFSNFTFFKPTTKSCFKSRLSCFMPTWPSLLCHNQPIFDLDSKHDVSWASLSLKSTKYKLPCLKPLNIKFDPSTLMTSTSSLPNMHLKPRSQSYATDNRLKSKLSTSNTLEILISLDIAIFPSPLTLPFLLLLLEICPRDNHISLYSWLIKCSLNIHGWQLVLINAYVKYLWNSLLVWIF